MQTSAPRKSSDRTTGTPFQLILLVMVSMIFLGSAQVVNAQESNPRDGEALSKAISTFNDAQDLHEQGLLKEAIALYKKAIQLAGLLPEAEFQLGNAFLQIEDKSEAEQAFRRALETRPEWTLPIPPLARLLAERGRIAEALQLIENGLELEEENPSLWSEKTRIYISASKPREQLDPLRSKLKELTRGARPAVAALTALASLEMFLGDYESAYLTIRRAVDLEPEDFEALRTQFEIQISGAQFLSALETSDRLSRIKKNDLAIRLMRARALVGLGRKNEAVQLLKTFEVSETEITKTARELLIEIVEDRSGLMELLARFPDDARVLFKICTLRSVIEAEDVISSCSLLISKSTEYRIAALGARAAMFLRLGRATEALSDFERILTNNPESKSARSGRSLALFNLERWDDARLSFEDIVASSDEFPIAYYYLGIINDKLARPEDSLSNYEQFLKVADRLSMGLEIERTQLRLSSLRRQVRPRRN